MSLSLPPITATVNKTASESSGLYLYKDEEGRIIVNDIPNGTAFSNTNLQQSMEIVSVNGLGCDGMTDDFVKSLIDDANGKVTIVARELVYEAVIVEEEDIEMNPGSSSALPPPVAPHYNTHDSRSSNSAPPLTNPQVQQRQSTQTENRSSSRRSPPHGCINGGRWTTIRVASDVATQCKTSDKSCKIPYCRFEFSGGSSDLGAFLFGAFIYVNILAVNVLIGVINVLLFFLVPLVCSCCGCVFDECPSCCLPKQDRKDVYLLEDDVYDESGKHMGKVSSFKF
jgi:hypothetical protein